jgi:hypothetical protein
MSRSYNFFLKSGALSLAALLLAGCLTRLEPYGDAPEDRQAILEIENGLNVTLFDGNTVNWGTDSFFGGYAEIAIPAGTHTLRVTARKEASEEADAGVITNVYVLSAETRIDFLPRRRYRINEDSSFLDFFLGATELKLKIREVNE